jgi:transposase
MEHGETPRIRRRAHAILLSGSGKTVNEIAEIFGIRRETVTFWLNNWEQSGPLGLADKARPGAPPKLSEEEKEKVLQLLREQPQSPKMVLKEIPKVIGNTISRSTLRRIARSSGLRWRRMRRSLRSQQDQDDFREAQQELSELVASHKAGDLDLFYFDEAGFSLTPTVPYGWQPIGERVEIPSRKSKQINALGFFRYDSKLKWYTVDESIDSEIVIACFKDFAKSLRKAAVVVIDNASVHTSAAFESHIPLWEAKGLFLYFLPPYCPELNLIEIIWRMIKHHWLPLNAYESFQCLMTELHKVLSQIGSKYVVDFT